MTTISFVPGLRVEIFSGTSVMYRTSGAQSNTACKHLYKTFHRFDVMWFYVKMLEENYPLADWSALIRAEMLHGTS